MGERRACARAIGQPLERCARDIGGAVAKRKVELGDVLAKERRGLGGARKRCAAFLEHRRRDVDTLKIEPRRRERCEHAAVAAHRFENDAAATRHALQVERDFRIAGTRRLGAFELRATA